MKIDRPMRNITRHIAIMLLVTLCATTTYAQRVSLRGVVVNEKGEGLGFTAVALNDGALGVVCDSRGEFAFDNLKVGEYSYSISQLGYSPKEGVLTLSKSSDYVKFVLKELTLNLEQVVVTAERSDIGSHAKINEEAILHVQPKSLTDIMQLLPGGLTTNPSLNDMGQISLREIGGNSNNSLGAALIVDGAQLSNDANMQTMSFTKDYNRSGVYAYDSEGSLVSQSTANKGVDLRSVSAENIESVEVIRGIPSAEYGNLTSGLVIVNTKSGVTPFEIKAKTDAFSKLFYAGKGFSLGSGVMNIGGDYSSSFSDPRKQYMGYERLTASLGYSTTFNEGGKRPVSFNLKSSFYSNINAQSDDDPQLKELGQIFRNENTGARLTINGDVKINGWLTKLDYNLSGQIAQQNDYKKTYVSSPDQVITASREDGIFEAQFNDKPYYCEYTINGVPINLYAQLKTNKYIQLGKNNFTNFKLGADYKFDVNLGDGLLFDLDTPPQAMGSQRLRPRAYYEIPALHNISAFLENDSSISLGSHTLKTNIGVRANYLVVDEEVGGRGSIFALEPRANLAYVLVDKDKGSSALEYFSVLGGFGVSNKMPTLLSLYPEYAYYDYQNLAYKAGPAGSELALMTTKVIKDTTNPNLKPMTSTKWEVGTNFTLFGVEGSLTYYNEKSINEFGYTSQLDMTGYKLYSVPAGSYDLDFKDGNLSYTNAAGEAVASAAYEDKAYFNTWYMPSNDTESYKHGLEYTLDFGQYKPLRTSLYIDGAWFYTKRIDTTTGLNVLSDKTYNYAALCPAGDGDINERLNTNFRFITHIPKVGMVFTTTVQVVWFESSQTFYEDENGNPLYDVTADGEFYAINPLGFYDKAGNYTEWREEFSTDVTYERMLDKRQLYAFKEDIVKPWILLNFRLTKELGSIGSVSVMANNFLSKRVWHTNENSLSKRKISPAMYVGAEVKINL